MDDADLASIREQQNLSRTVQRIQKSLSSEEIPPGPVECEDCGEKISPQRIEVYPGARRCIACQTAVER